MSVGPVDSSNKKQLQTQPLPPKKAPENTDAPAPNPAQLPDGSTQGTAKDKTTPKPAQIPDGYEKDTAKDKTKVELNPQNAETDFKTRTTQVETDLKDGKVGQALDTMLNSEGDNVKLKLSGEAMVLIPRTPVKVGSESGTEVKVTRAKDGSYDVSVLNEGKLKAGINTADMRGGNTGGQQAGADASGTIELGAGFSPKYNFKSKEDLDRGLKAIAQWGAGNPMGGALSAGVDVAAKVNGKVTGGLAGLADAVGLDSVSDKLDEVGDTFKKVDDAVGLDQDEMKFLTQNMTGVQLKGGSAVELAGKLNLPQGELEGKFKGSTETSLDITFGKDGKPPTVKVKQSGNIDLSAAGMAGPVVGPQGEVKGNVRVSSTQDFELHGNLDPSKLLKGDFTAGVDPKLVSNKASIELGVGAKAGAQVTLPADLASAKADAGLSGKVTLSANTADLVKALDNEALTGLAQYDPSALLSNLGDTKLTVDRELSGTGTLNGKIGLDTKVASVGVTAEAAWTDVLHKDPKPRELTGAQLGEEMKGLPSDFASLLATLGPQEFRAWTRQALVG